MVIGLIGFANLSTNIALKNSAERFFKDEIQSDIEHQMDRFQIDSQHLSEIVDEILPEGSLLHRFISPTLENLS